jgi:hypothetical protein
MMVARGEVKGDSLGASRRLEGDLLCFCCHAGGVWAPSDAILTIPTPGSEWTFEKFLFFCKPFTFDTRLITESSERA